MVNKMITANFKDTQIDKESKLEALCAEGMDYDTAFERVYEMHSDIDELGEFDELECHELGDGFSMDVGSFSSGEYF